jgi:kumamolisin
MPEWVALPGTAHRLTAAQLSRTRSLGDLGEADLSQTMEATLLLRENPEGPGLADRIEAVSTLPPGARRHLSLEELASAHGSVPEDVERVSAWARGAGLEVVGSDPATRRLRVRGRVGQMGEAFHVRLERFETTSPGGTPVTYRDHRDPISVPAELEGIVVHVGGLSTRPIAQPHFRTARPSAVAAVFTPEQLAEVYRFPPVPGGGAGLTLDVGIAELGGRADPAVVRWFTAAHPGVSVIEDTVGGGPLPQPDPGGADVEVALDWQVLARALLTAAPQARIRLVLRYAPNTDQGFADLWNSFAGDRTYSFAGVSTSWGSAEDTWSPSEAGAMDAAAQACLAVGIFHVAASGDSGASDGSTDGKVYADHPASSPNVLAAGGTRLTLSATGAIDSEVVWNEATLGEGAGGGGVSMYFPVPSYQSAHRISETSLSTGSAGRSEPDMAADADPVTGYEVVTGVDAAGNPTTTTVGGTSAVAPLLTAGFVAVAAVLGGRLGRIQDAAYSLAASGRGFHDVTQGNNAYPAGTQGYSAGPGFDVPSGWGSPIFSELAAGFAAGSAGTSADLRGRGRERAPEPGGAGPQGASG